MKIGDRKLNYFRGVATFALLVFALVAALAPAASGQTLYWDTNGSTSGVGGTGTWDFSSANWNPVAAGTSATTTWTDGNRAEFRTPAGIVTLGANVSASGLTITASGYTISGSDSLTLTSTNTSNADFAAIQTTYANASTISAPVILGGGSNSTQRIHIGTAGSSLTISGGISQTNSNVGVSKTGAGRLVLSGASSFTGTTSITAGTLEAAATDALGGTSRITVGSGGTLLLSNSGTTDRIGNSTGITLAGGTFNTGGLSEGAASSPGIGALTLTANSIIDLANGASILSFANSSGETWATGAIISIYNYTGTAFTGGGTDQLFFGSNSSGLTSDQLSRFRFYSDNGTTLVGSMGDILGNGEVVPVPEPSTWAAGLLALSVIGYSQRRRLAKLLPVRPV